MYDETIWVRGLRILTWILLGVGVIGGISSAWSTARTVNTWTGETEFAFLTFLLILAVSVVGTFILAASIMVFLDIAADVSASRQINSEMLRIMQQGSFAASPTSVKCTRCNKVYESTCNSCPHCGSREQKPTLTSIAAKSTASTDSFWWCSHCGDKNPSNVRICKGCEKYK